jgi:hypothetical protein
MSASPIVVRNRCCVATARNPPESSETANVMLMADELDKLPTAGRLALPLAAIVVLITARSPGQLTLTEPYSLTKAPPC